MCETVRTQEAPAGNWIADIMREEMACDCAIVNSGVMRANLVYLPGVLKLKDILDILPMEDIVVSMLVPGIPQPAWLDPHHGFSKPTGCNSPSGVAKRSESFFSQSFLFSDRINPFISVVYFWHPRSRTDGTIWSSVGQLWTAGRLLSSPPLRVFLRCPFPAHLLFGCPLSPHLSGWLTSNWTPIPCRPPGFCLKEALECGVSKFPALEGRFPQVSGLKLLLDPTAKPMERIKDIMVGGKLLMPQKLYKLATTSYLSTGGDGCVWVLSGWVGGWGGYGWMGSLSCYVAFLQWGALVLAKMCIMKCFWHTAVRDVYMGR